MKLETEFELSQYDSTHTKRTPYPVFLLKHHPGGRRLVAIATNDITLEFDRPLTIPTGTNLIFLTLDMKRSLAGKLQAAALRPEPLWVVFSTPAGERVNHASAGLLATGVLVNRQVESAAETRRWLSGAVDQNPAVSAISLRHASPWAFQLPIQGALVEYQLVETGTTHGVRAETGAGMASATENGMTNPSVAR